MAKSQSIAKRKTKKYQIELTPLSAVLWGIFLFFLLTWIFVLGLLVGRGFLPGNVTTIEDLKNQISKLQQMIGNKDHKDSSQKTVLILEDPKLAFYEKLSSKKDEVKNKTDSVEKKDDTAGRLLLPEPEKVERSLPPEDKEQISLSLTSIAEDASLEAQYTVQLASLGEKEKAEKMITRLIDAGYPAYYYETNVRGKLYYRVRCGKFVHKAEADKLARDLAEKEGINGFVSRLE
ncbi:MAG: SPOR domain-containing protein [Deltaproteobacteria bacterium]|nr:SPOR domain-containing protein [Deltaproteobacteria bacterium]